MFLKEKLRPFARIVRNCARFLRDSISVKQRFVRLTPLVKGQVNFWDKKSNQIITLTSRGDADSAVLDSIF